MDSENDRMKFADDENICEYCGFGLTVQEIEDNGTVCNHCMPTDSLVRKIDAGVLEDVEVVHEI